MTKNKSRDERLQAFADQHGITLEKKGEVGFGRPCVGFLKGNNYVDYPPVYGGPNYDEIIADCDFPTVENAYHKYNCLAVLVENEDYEKALDELLEWVEKMEARGPVRVQTYRTGHTGLQAMVSGTLGHVIELG